MKWTSPGDDGAVGRAAVYDLRMSTAPLTAANFLAATVVTGLPVPKAAGAAETFTVTNLVPGMSYYFAIRTGDEVPNWSAVSNIFMNTAATTATHPVALAIELSASWPNPARESAHWSYSLAQAGAVRIEAFDAAGRRIRAIANGWQPAGASDVTWDLHDDGGRKVPAGVYLVRADIAGRTVVRRVVVAN